MADKRVTIVISSAIDKKLSLIKETDKRSIQKEVEWLIERRYEEINNGK